MNLGTLLAMCLENMIDCLVYVTADDDVVVVISFCCYCSCVRDLFRKKSILGLDV